MTSYFELEPGIFAGKSPGFFDLEEIQKLRVKVIVSLVNLDFDVSKLEKLGYEHHYVLFSKEVTPKFEQLKGFIDIISESQKEHKSLYIHEDETITRPTLFLGAYLISKGLSSEDAIIKISEKLPGAFENKKTRLALINYEVRCNKEKK